MTPWSKANTAKLRGFPEVSLDNTFDIDEELLLMLIAGRGHQVGSADRLLPIKILTVGI